MAQGGTDISAPPSFYRPELDALRFFAFLVVFVHHQPHLAPEGAQGALAWLGSAQSAGKFGVSLFFVLSSYLITELLLRELRAFGALDVKAFLVRRTLRIWPLYFFVLLVAQPLVHLLNPEDAMLGSQRLAFLAFLGNWVCIFLWMPHSFVNVLWSVSVEEQFYLVWPFLLRKARSLVPLALGCLALAWLTRVVLVLRGAPEYDTWLNSFVHLDSIALGALCSVWLPRSGQRRLSGVTAGLGFLAGWLIWVAAEHWLDTFGPTSLALYPLVSVGAVMMLLSVTLYPWRKVPSQLLYLGRISYGLYVFHTLGIGIVWKLMALRSSRLQAVVGPFDRNFEWLVYAVASLALTVLLAGASYRWLEAPFLTWKRRFARIRSGAGEAAVAV